MPFTAKEAPIEDAIHRIHEDKRDLVVPQSGVESGAILGTGWNWILIDRPSSRT
jgi:hypothetical protein